MKRARLILLLAVTAAVLYIPAVGFSEGSADDGARLGKTCAGCHGTFGNTPGEYIGKIGGQSEIYLKNVLTGFKNGKRPGSVEMTIISKGYTDDQLESLAKYFALQEWVNSTNTVDSAKAEAGKALSGEYGCLDCHGEKGVGMDDYPRIGGQNVGYLYEVLKRYRSGAVKSDEMTMVADFSDEQLEALANFMSGLK